MKLISSMLRDKCSTAKSSDICPGLALSETAVCRKCMESRDQVRKMLITAKKNKSDVSQAALDAIADDVMCAINALENGASDVHSEIAGQLLAELRRAAVEFQAALKNPSSDKFAACDELRGVLRTL